MTKTATLIIDGKSLELPIIEGTMGDRGLDITQLRAQTGCITYDPGYVNTGPCKSAITFVDGENGVLRYRGYPIDQIASRGSFTETAWLLIFGELPTRVQLSRFSAGLCAEELLHEDVKHHFEGFAANGHPMAMLSAIVNSLGCYHPDLLEIESRGEFYLAASKIISKVRTIAAFSYRKSMGLPFMYPDPALSYCRNFLHMMFSIPHATTTPPRRPFGRCRCSLCCTLTTSKTAPPAPCAWSDRARPTSSPRSPLAFAPCGAACTAGPMLAWWKCWSRSAMAS